MKTVPAQMSIASAQIKVKSWKSYSNAKLNCFLGLRKAWN